MPDEYLKFPRGFDPYQNPAANNLMDGIARHTEWDVYAERHIPNEAFYCVLDTADANGGNGAYTNFAEAMPYSNPQAITIYSSNQNYQGIAPMELQPTLDLPEPWEQSLG